MDKQSLQAHFRNNRQELSVTRHIYLPDPNTLNTMDRLTYQGAQAARYAEEFREMIQTMESYQSLIYDRVQALTTAPYHTEIHLRREKWYQNKVKYYLDVKKVYDTLEIEPETIKRNVYPGTGRSQAIKDFEAYQKSHPGIIAVKDIEKSKWER